MREKPNLADLRDNSGSTQRSRWKNKYNTGANWNKDNVNAEMP